MRRSTLLSAVALALGGATAAPAVAAAVPLTVLTTGPGGVVDVTADRPLPLPACSLDRCVYQLVPGTRVGLSAVAARTDTRLAAWTGTCAPLGASPRCVFAMTAPAIVGAQFTPVPPRPSAPQCDGDVCKDEGPLSQGVKVTVRITGRGAVRASALTTDGKPPGTCRRTKCWFFARRGAPVTLQAVTAGSSFVGFAGPCLARTPTCQFAAFPTAARQDPVIRATFRP